MCQSVKTKTNTQTLKIKHRDRVADLLIADVKGLAAFQQRLHEATTFCCLLASSTFCRAIDSPRNLNTRSKRWSPTRSVCIIIIIVCPMQCMCIGQNIKSCKRPSVHPFSVCIQDYLCTDFHQNLGHSFPVSYWRKDFLSSSIRSSICTCTTINWLSLTSVEVLHKRLM